MWQQRILSGWAELALAWVSLAVLYVAIIAYTRLAGLRSFSKISAFDFAMTLAIGSLFGTAIANPDPSLLLALGALAGLFAGQWLLAGLRRRWPRVEAVLDNRPLLLMYQGEVIEPQLRRAQMRREDLLAKLRASNVRSLEQVQAVVFETTGEVTVLHGEQPLDPRLLEGVERGAAARTGQGGMS